MKMIEYNHFICHFYCHFSLYSFNCQSYEKIMVQAQKMAKKLVYSQGKVYFRGEFK